MCGMVGDTAICKREYQFSVVVIQMSGYAQLQYECACENGQEVQEDLRSDRVWCSNPL